MSAASGVNKASTIKQKSFYKHLQSPPYWMQHSCKRRRRRRNVTLTWGWRVAWRGRSARGFRTWRGPAASCSCLWAGAACSSSARSPAAPRPPPAAPPAGSAAPDGASCPSAPPASAAARPFPPGVTSEVQTLFSFTLFHGFVEQNESIRVWQSAKPPLAFSHA